jgi:hypothetical protein
MEVQQLTDEERKSKLIELSRQFHSSPEKQDMMRRLSQRGQQCTECNRFLGFREIIVCDPCLKKFEDEYYDLSIESEQ